MTSDGHEQLDLTKRQDQTGKLCVCGEEDGGGQNFHFNQNVWYNVTGAAVGDCGLQNRETVSSYKCTLLLGNQLDFCSLTGHSADCAAESLLVAKSLERTQIPLRHFLFLQVGSIHLSTSIPWCSEW